MKKKFIYSNFLDTVIETFMVILFSVVIALESYNLFGRYIKLYPPLMWVEEFTRYSFIWICFLLWHLLDRRGIHFVVDILPNKLSGKKKEYLELFINLIVIFFCGIVILSSVKYVSTAMVYCTSSFRWLPMGIVYAIIPIGLLMVLIERIQLLRKNIDKMRSNRR